MTPKDIIAYVEAHPKISSTALSEHFLMKSTTMAARLKGMFDRNLLSREEGPQRNGRPTYLWFRSADNVDVHAGTVRKAPEKRQKRTPVSQVLDSTQSVHSFTERSFGANLGANAAETCVSSQDIGALFDGAAQALAHAFVSRFLMYAHQELREGLEAMSLPATQSVAVSATDVAAMVKSCLAPGVKEKEATLEKPRIGVVGLMPVQAGEIQTRLGDKFSFVFSDGTSSQQTRHIGESCDVTFLHTRHSSHSTQNILRQTKTRLILVKGGVTSMVDAIVRYAASLQKPMPVIS